MHVQALQSLCLSMKYEIAVCANSVYCKYLFVSVYIPIIQLLCMDADSVMLHNCIYNN